MTTGRYSTSEWNTTYNLLLLFFMRHKIQEKKRLNGDANFTLTDDDLMFIVEGDDSLIFVLSPNKIT
jgi:hypothetical protein